MGTARVHGNGPASQRQRVPAAEIGGQHSQRAGPPPDAAVHSLFKGADKGLLVYTRGADALSLDEGPNPGLFCSHMMGSS